MFRIALLSFIFLVTSASAQLQTDDFWSDWPTKAIPKKLSENVLLSTEVQWRLDCSLDSGTLIGQISAAAPGANGRILLLDGQLTQVMIMALDGQVERAFGQPGEGPGDLPGAHRLFELSDGRIGVCGGVSAPTVLFGGSSKIVLLNQNGDPAGQLFGVGDPSLLVVSIRELRCAQDNILVAGSGGSFSEGALKQVQELTIIDPKNGARTMIVKREIVESLSKTRIFEGDVFEPFAYGRCDISNTGRVAFAPERDHWLVVIRNSDGTGFVLKREWDQIKRTKAQKTAVWKNLGGTDDCIALDFEPAIARVRWRPNGNLWVEPFGVESRDGAIACFDEFSSSGEYLRRIKIEVQGHDSTDDLQILEDGRLVLLRGFEGDFEADDISDQKGEVILLEIIE